jgi:hypothetical protein
LVREGTLDLEAARRSGLFDVPGLFGMSTSPRSNILSPIAALASVDVYPDERWFRKEGESAMAMIERVVPRLGRVDLLPPPEEIIPS